MATRKKTKKKAAKRRPVNAYVPTARSKRMVREMIALGLTNVEIASLTTNPQTGRAITEKTLVANFKAELGDDRKGGKPAFEPDDRQRQQVLAMQGMDMTTKEIASIITNPMTNAGISTDTLHKHFRKELDQGQAMMKFGVLGRLYTTARSPDHPGATSAGIFLAKTQYGYSEKHQIEEMEGCGVLVAPRAVSIDVWIDGEEVKNADRRAPVDDND